MAESDAGRASVLIARLREKDRNWRERSEEDIRAALRKLAHFVWYGKAQQGEHYWTIPPDFERDFDCILGDAIDELMEWRKSAALTLAVPAASERQEEKK